MGLALLAHADMPISYWDHSFITIVYLINRLPTIGLPKFISYYVTLYNKQPDYMTLKVFGCLCFPLLMSYIQHKLMFRSKQCVYLGVSPTYKAHKFLGVEGRIFISKDVRFNEAEYPFSKLFSSIPGHSLKGNIYGNKNVLLILPNSNSTSMSHISAKPKPHMPDLHIKSQAMNIPNSLTPTQLSPSQNIFETHSNDPSHVSNYFQSRLSRPLSYLGYVPPEPNLPQSPIIHSPLNPSSTN